MQSSGAKYTRKHVLNEGVFELSRGECSDIRPLLLLVLLFPSMIHGSVIQSKPGRVLRKCLYDINASG